MKRSRKRNRQTCPRRMQEFGTWDRVENMDRWAKRERHLTCTFCGSLHPDTFIELVEAGFQVGPTDKSYKAYLVAPDGAHVGKFYYQHLSKEQQMHFIEIYNAGNMHVGYPGYFYCLPYFCSQDGEAV